MEPRYDIDPKELSLQFKQYQRFIHPDKFEQAQTDLKCRAQELSAFANSAFSTLMNDIARADYLLKLSKA